MSELTCTSKNVNLVINRLTREMYNELSSSLSPYELYLIDDVDFDVCDKKIINVLNPVKDYDATNKIYVDSNFLKTSMIENYVDTSKIVTNKTLNANCISSDCNIYSILTGESDWKVFIERGEEIEPSQVSVFFYLPGGGTGSGWACKVNSGTHAGLVVYSGNPDRNTMTFRATTEDGQIVIIGKRDCWEKKDSLVKKSDIISELSSITSSSSTSEIGTALHNLYEKLKY